MPIKRNFNRSGFLIYLIILNLTASLFSSQASSPEPPNFAAIRHQAIFSNAVYLPEADIQKLIESTNYELTHYRNIEDLQVTYIVVTNHSKKQHTVAVRGTSNVENALIDISLKLVLDKQLGIRLHNGFAMVAKSIYAELKPFLNKDYAINTTGHSLGGAVALILAIHLDQGQFNVAQVTTFGQPKVTDFQGANQLKNLNIDRIVMPRDLVPLVPPFDPLDINNIEIYWHAGKEIILLDDTRYSIVGGVDAMLRATKFTQQLLDQQNISNHQMLHYIKAINKKIPTAKYVTYENNFNLFNLFGTN